MRKVTRKEYVCKVCRESFFDYPKRVRIFCSKECFNLGIGDIMKGHPTSVETREKISEAHKGMVFTAQHIAKLRKSHKNLPSNVKGKHWKLSSVAKKHIRNGHLGKKSSFWKGGISLVPGYAAFCNRIRDYRIKGNGGKHTFQEWLSLKEKYDNKCLRCGRTEPEVKITEDHVIPLKLGGDNNISNIQPLCFSCNCKKKFKETDYRYA